MTSYQDSGVNTQAGELAVSLMKNAINSAQRSESYGEFGGFAGLFDASKLKNYQKPLLATATDGVGTKIEIARKLDIHNTIGIDLVAMVVDDLVVTGAEPLFITDYIACGKVEPKKIADIVSGIATGAQLANVSLLGGETAEHPGLMQPDEYDLACAGTAVVEEADLLGKHKVANGDVVIGIRSSGLHSNGYSLVRKIVSDQKLDLNQTVDEFGRSLGLELLEPTRIYTQEILQTIKPHFGNIHAISHITGGGIAANIARVIPSGLHLDIDRNSWQPHQIFRYLANAAKIDLKALEDTWNLGIGMTLIVKADSADSIIKTLKGLNLESWVLGELVTHTNQTSDAVAKGGAAGSVALVSSYR
jgi:phosphoribosylformylglycinamidine cyclo-ligase